MSDRRRYAYQVPVLSGGLEGRRRILIVLPLVIILELFLVPLLFACGAGGTCSWSWVVGLLALVIALVGMAGLFWFYAVVPATVADARHMEGGAGQLGAAQRTFPSQDVIYDPSYGRREPPP